jgi:energy-coupling factor transporter ATP-binding protein EcfA2
VARRPLPRILSNGGAQLARSRELARTAADSATDVLHPLITITRGLRRLASAGRRRWAATPKDRRGTLLFAMASLVLVVALAPYGPLLAVVTLMAAAAWQGRDRTPRAPEGPDGPQAERLKSLYEALVPYFSTAEDPEPLFAHGGDWQKAFSEYAFDDTGRITELVIRYPAYFTDGEPESRARIEHLLSAKSGRGREYHFGWDEEGNRLTVRVLAPLPTDIAAQPFVTAPGETVLGFTDPTRVQRTLPLTHGAHGEERRDVPPVVWRTGVRSTEPHLLVLGQPGSGTSTLLRSIALQALHHGDVVIVDGGDTGEYACLTGRDGVLAVECGLTGATTSLEWAAHETERRLIAANRAHQAGDPPPEDTRRPLWLLLDRPTAFTHLAAADGRKDPQSLLQVPLRHGRPANVTVVVADQLDCFESLAEPVRQHTRARVVLGAAPAEQLTAVLGAPPHTTPVDQVPPGRGYARLGAGPVHRLQVPATPDPYDDATSDAHRQAVLDLLPPRTTPADEEPQRLEPEPAEPVTRPVFVSLDKASTRKAPAVPVAAGTEAPAEEGPADEVSATAASKEPVPAEAAVAESTS